MREKHTRPMGSLVEVCFKRYAIGEKTPEQVIMENWPRIVGENFASRCAPERIDARKNLIIKVSNPTLRRELQFIEDRMMTKLRSLESCGHIRGIVLRAG